MTDSSVSESMLKNTIRVALLAACLLLSCALISCGPQPTNEQLPDVVKKIIDDAGWYHTLWTRWTLTDWVLTLLAAGTAISAAVKNAFSAHNQAQAERTGEVSKWSSRVDRWVMIFAALTIIATTLDGKMHAAQQAERYRLGDLLLQDAIMDYRGSSKRDADVQNLLDRWHEAQSILEGRVTIGSGQSSRNSTPAQSQTDGSRTPAEAKSQ